jgi:hypothetical protein
MSNKGAKHGNECTVWVEPLVDLVENLYSLQGLTHAEIADYTGLSTKAVKTKVGNMGFRLTPQARQLRKKRQLNRELFVR